MAVFSYFKMEPNFQVRICKDQQFERLGGIELVWGAFHTIPTQHLIHSSRVKIRWGTSGCDTSINQLFSKASLKTAMVEMLRVLADEKGSR